MTVLEDLYKDLKSLVSPKFKEEGPPQYVQSILEGQDYSVPMRPILKSALELMTIGYRPATSLAILGILSGSPNVALHGMEIGRELERRFEVDGGWFTQTRYYSDRVARVLYLLSRLAIVQEVTRKNPRGGRSMTAYRIHPSAGEAVRTRLEGLTRGEPLTLFGGLRSKGEASVLLMRDKARECTRCGILLSSETARYCERCGQPLRITCETCGRQVEAVYAYCLNCGKKLH